MKPTQRLKAEHKQKLTVVGFPVPWITPGASQVFQAAGSERQASALQIHHLSLPLLPSGKSVSTTAEEGGRLGEREGGRGDSGVGGEGSD